VLESLLLFLENVVIPLGGGGVFLASVIEEVVAPIPSALVMTLSGFLFIGGPVNFGSIFELIYKVALPAAAGVTLGSLAVYAVAWWGGKILLDKWGKWIGLYWSDVEKMELKMKSSKRDEVAMLVARILPFVPSVAVSALCGFLRMHIFKYLYITFIGTLIRGFILGAIGWQVGNTYYKYAAIISRYEKLGLVIIITAVIVGLCFLFLKKRKQS
jgi:membrane protein DedA with SNARE-associated domain